MGAAVTAVKFVGHVETRNNALDARRAKDVQIIGSALYPGGKINIGQASNVIRVIMRKKHALETIQW